MPLDRQKVTLPFTGGLDSKSDPKQVAHPKLSYLLNGVFTNPGKITKRNGYVPLGLAPSSTGKGLATLGDELLSFDGLFGYAWDDTNDAYQSKGEVASIRLDRTPVVHTGARVMHQDAALFGTLICTAWEQWDADGTVSVHYAVKDTVTGQLIVPDSDVGYGNGCSQPKVVTFGNYFLIFFCQSTNLLVGAIDGMAATNAPSVTTLADNARALSAYCHNYDVFAGDTNCYVVWNATITSEEFAARALYLNMSLEVSTPITVDPDFTDADGGICVHQELSGGSYDGTVVISYSNGVSLSAIGYENDLETVAHARISVVNTPNITNVTTRTTGTGSFRCAFTIGTGGTSATASGSVAVSISAWTAGTPIILARNICVASKIFKQGTFYYVWVATGTTLQSSYYLVNVATGTIVARGLTNAGGGLTKRGSLPEVYANPYQSTTSFTVALIEQTNSQNVNGVITPLQGVVLETMTWNDSKGCWNFLEHANNLHLSGGMLQMYDGSHIVEHGFHRFPESVVASTALYTVVCGAVVADDTLVISGTTLTAKTSGATGPQFNVGATTTETALNLAAVINARDIATYTGGPNIRAISQDATVYLFAGQSIVSCVQTGGHMTVTLLSNAYGTITLSSFAAGDFVIIQGVQFTGVASGAVGTQFNIGGTDILTASALVDAINWAGLSDGAIRASNIVAAGTAAATIQIYLSGSVDFSWATSGAHATLALLTQNTINSYQYSVCYEWTDSRGQIHRSAPSVPVTIKLGVGITQAAPACVLVEPLYLTRKEGVKIIVYRTEANGSIFYQNTFDELATTTALANLTVVNDKELETVTFFDTMSDVYLIKNPPLYTAGGVLENICAPPCTALITWQNRVVLLDSEHPLMAWFSKEVRPGAPVEFSDFLTIPIDPRGGPTVAIGSMDEKLIAFKSDLCFYLPGNPPDATGGNGTISNCVPIPSSSGCFTPKSLILTMDGLMRQTSKGIWILSRSLQDQYIGADIEGQLTTSTPVVSATIIPSTTRVQFQTTTQTLVYDYYVRQWSIFNIVSVGAVIWRGLYTFLTSDSLVNVETPGAYYDGVTGAWIKLGLITSWQQLNGILGFQRVRRMLVLGDYKSPHNLTVKIRYDYATAPTQTVVLVNSAAPAAAEEWLVHFTQQKCSAVQIEIYDGQITSPAPVAVGEGVSLSGLVFEIGVERGTKRLPATLQGA